MVDARDICLLRGCLWILSRQEMIASVVNLHLLSRVTRVTRLGGGEGGEHGDVTIRDCSGCGGDSTGHHASRLIVHERFVSGLQSKQV